MTPKRFREELQRFDRRLDFIWSGRKQRYEIVGIDARQKKYLIASFGLGKIDTLGLDYLRAMAEATPREKSAKEINQRIDNIIERQEAQESKELQASIDDRIDEALEHYGYKEGFRVSFADVKNEQGQEVIITDHRRFINELTSTEPASTGVKQQEEENVNQK